MEGNLSDKQASAPVTPGTCVRWPGRRRTERVLLPAGHTHARGQAPVGVRAAGAPRCKGPTALPAPAAPDSDSRLSSSLSLAGPSLTALCLLVVFLFFHFVEESCHCEEADEVKNSKEPLPNSPPGNKLNSPPGPRALARGSSPS